MVVKHRKNLPSLNNQTENTAGSHQNGRSQSKGTAGGASRGISNDSGVPMAIQIHGSQQQFTNASSGTTSAANAFLNAGSRENSQASGSHSKAASNGGVVYTAGSNQKSSYHHGDGSNINLNQVNSQGNTHGSNQALGSTKNSSNADKKVVAPGGAVESSKPTTKVDDTIL